MISGGEQVAENVSQMIFNFHERIQRNSSDDKISKTTYVFGNPYYYRNVLIK